MSATAMHSAVSSARASTRGLRVRSPAAAAAVPRAAAQAARQCFATATPQQPEQPRQPLSARTAPQPSPRAAVVARAASVEAITPESEGKARSLRVFASLAGWFALNAFFAVMNKRTLSVFPYPWLLSWIQIATGAVFMVVMWQLKVFKAPEGGLTMDKCKALVPTAVLHLIAHVSACASYNLSSVSFMQVVKAAEPVCSVVMLSLFFGQRYTPMVWATLVPIVLGVAVGSVTELNFSMMAFILAMTSNLACALRGVTSKAMQTEIGLRGINLYAGIAIVSSVLLLPAALLVEGGSLQAAFANAPALFAAKGFTFFGITGFLPYLFIGSMFYHLYNQTSYQALAEMSPLTHSVANTVKRVVIILASVAVFRNPITPLGAASAAVAILGTFLYSLARQQATKEDCAVKPQSKPMC